jgi:hypothetical protein
MLIHKYHNVSVLNERIDVNFKESIEKSVPELFQETTKHNHQSLSGERQMKITYVETEKVVDIGITDIFQNVVEMNCARVLDSCIVTVDYCVIVCGICIFFAK